MKDLQIQKKGKGNGRKYRKMEMNGDGILQMNGSLQWVVP